MSIVLSSSTKSFVTPSDVNVGGIQYSGVMDVSTKNIIDGDGKQKSVSNIGRKNSHHVLYMENNEVTSAVEYFHKPQKMMLGNKLYTNIVSKRTVPNKYDTYDIFAPNGQFKQIRVRKKNGAVLDISELKTKLFKRKLKQPIEKTMQIAKNMLLSLGKYGL